MALLVTCDGCGKPVGTDAEPNYWKATFMGDVIMGSGGKILDTTGMRARNRRTRFYEKDSIRQADVCIACMSKTQEEDEDAASIDDAG